MDSFPVEILTNIAEHLTTSSLINFVFLTSKRFFVLLTSQRGVRNVVIAPGTKQKFVHYGRGLYMIPFPSSLLSFQSLEYLELNANLSYDDRASAALQWPKTLKVLKITKCRLFRQGVVKSGQVVSGMVPLNEVLPNLTTLELNGGFYQPVEDEQLELWMATFPASLTRFSCGTEMRTAFRGLPTTVTDLEVSGDHHEIQSLPQRVCDALRILTWKSQWKNAFASRLTRFPNLTSLTTQNSFDMKWTPDELLQLPHLTYFRAGTVCMNSGSLVALPHSLTHLQISWNTSIVSDFSLFPPNLRSLTWKQDHDLELSLSALPTGITDLEWALVPRTRPTKLFHVDFGFLPPALTSFRFFRNYSRIEIQEFEKLGNYSALTTMKFACGQFGERDLFLLPRQLTTLALYDIPENVEDEWFQGLPPRLTRLKADQVRVTDFLRLSDHVVRYLPKSLTKLKFPHFFITGTYVPDHWTSLDDLGVIDSLARVMPAGIRHIVQSHISDRLLVSGKLSGPLIKKEGLLLGFTPDLQLRDLPPSVTSLTLLHCPVDVDTLATKHLKHMNVAVPIGALVSQRGIFSESQSFNRLESLHMQLSRSLQTQHLGRLTPNSLVELCLPNIDIIYGKALSPLPRSLKKLTVFSIDHKSIRAVLSSSNIVYLTVVYGTKLHSTHIGAMPRSLTKLRLGNAACQKCSWNDTGRMSPVTSDEMITHSGVIALPPALTQLEMPTIFGMACSEFASLPKSLKILKPRFIQVSLSDLNLDGLETLSLPDMIDSLVQKVTPSHLKLAAAPARLFVSDHDTEALPPTLTAFSLKGHYNNLGDPFLSTLPPNLTTLQLPDQLNLSVRSLSLLPPTLTHLCLRLKGFKTSHFELIPHTIQHLELLGQLGNCAKASLLHTQLHTLYLDKSSGITNHFFTQLPPSLTKLTLSSGDTLQPNLGSYIPTTLTHLELQRVQATIDHSLLPSSLKYFSAIPSAATRL